MDRPIIVLHVESATDQGAPHLLELAAVRVDLGEVAETFEALVCPPVPIESRPRITRQRWGGRLRQQPWNRDLPRELDKSRI